MGNQLYVEYVHTIPNFKGLASRNKHVSVFTSCRIAIVTMSPSWSELPVLKQ